ncbi:hypothetical protein [Winogradskyella sp. A3E31]|uniref:hypothetical protein n=1 Tax=Winogradskyella sp. A3E31 TaxID=3349637 RepID=UPI00398ACCE1
MKSNIAYLNSENEWQDVDIKIRARGKFRKKNCFFTPLKLKVSKDNAKKTVFKGSRKLKLVMPCKKSNSSDFVLKEYLAYKMYEQISEYHFKTRLLDIEYKDVKKKDDKLYKFKGFVIEDDEDLAERVGGKVFDKKKHPANFDEVTVRNALFQFMIGNTDYSVSYQHNMKMLFVDKKSVPIPYDFDLCGLVDSDYAIVSDSRKNPLPITKVTERYYLGYKRDLSVYDKIRNEYLEKKPEILKVLDDHKTFFENIESYNKAKQFMLDFFKILESDSLFKKEIIDRAKTI